MVAKPPIGPPGSLSPTDWGARVNYDIWDDPYTPDDSLAIHHGGGGRYPAGQAPFSKAKEIGQLQAWERYHIDGRGWRGLAYGWAIGQTGTIYRIRGWNTYGAHSGDVDADHISNNREVIPVLFILSSGIQEPSPAAIAAFEYLREWIQTTLKKDRMVLWGHKELKGTITSCPGSNLMAYIVDHRYQVTPAPPPPPTTDWTEEVVMSLPTLKKYAGYSSKGQAHLRPDVKTGQALLLARGFKDRRTVDPETAADGYFGPGTETSVKEFQKAAGLRVDGVIGEKTWKKLLRQ